MKTIKSFLFTLIGALVVLVGSEVAIFKVIGKDGLRHVPIVGNLFTVVEKSDFVEEPKDERLDEIDAILTRLKERDTQDMTRDDQLEQLRMMQEDLTAIERRNRELFDRIRALYPIIEEARWEQLQVLAKKYEKMSSDGAAQILEGKTDQECAELLLAMNDRSSAKILESFIQLGDTAPEKERNRKRATKISQLMRNTLVLSTDKAALFSAPQ